MLSTKKSGSETCPKTAFSGFMNPIIKFFSQDFVKSGCNFGGFMAKSAFAKAFVSRQVSHCVPNIFQTCVSVKHGAILGALCFSLLTLVYALTWFAKSDFRRPRSLCRAVMSGHLHEPSRDRYHLRRDCNPLHSAPNVNENQKALTTTVNVLFFRRKGNTNRNRTNPKPRQIEPNYMQKTHYMRKS